MGSPRPLGGGGFLIGDIVQSDPMRYAVEAHTHDNAGLPEGPDEGLWFLRDDGEWVMPGASGPENWLGDVLIKSFCWSNRNTGDGEQQSDFFTYGIKPYFSQSPVSAPDWTSPARCHPRSAIASEFIRTEPYWAVTQGFWSRTLFGFDDAAIPDSDWNWVGMGGTTASDTHAPGFTDRWIGVKVTGTSVDFWAINGTNTTTVSSSVAATPGNVMAVDIRTLEFDDVEVKVSDLVTEDEDTHIFNGLTDDAVPNSNRFGTYSDPYTLKLWLYPNNPHWGLIRWDVATHTFAPWGNV